LCLGFATLQIAVEGFDDDDDDEVVVVVFLQGDGFFFSVLTDGAITIP
jgi:hypothetical protein